MLRCILLAAGCTALAAASTLSTTPATASDYGYLTNGGFESGSDGWSTSPNAMLDTVGAEVVAPASGSASGRITIVNSGAVIRQATRAGLGPATYHLSARVRVANPQTAVRVRYDAAPAPYTDAFDLPATTSGWYAFERDVALPGVETLTISIVASGAPGDVVYVDDVGLEGPPPMTMTPTPSPQPSATSTSVAATATRTPAATHTPRATATAAEAAGEAATPESAEAARVAGSGIVNGGFEDVGDDGVPSGWQKYGGTLTSAADARTGSRAARLASDTDSTKWMYETVTVDAGAWYAFEAWVSTPGAGVESALLRISWYASEDGSGEATGTADSTESISGWSAYTLLTTGAVQAPADARSAKLRIVLNPVEGAPTYLLADDARFGPADPADAMAAAEGAVPDDAPGDGATRAGGAAAAPGAARARASEAASVMAQAAGRGVVINEVLYDPLTTADADAEWVELYNPTDNAVTLDGWSLADGASTIALPPMAVEAHGFAVIAASGGFKDAYPAFRGNVAVLGRRIGNGMGNDGDHLRLLDAQGAVVDAISWGSDASVLSPAIEDAPAGHSIERRVTGGDTDVADDWADNDAPDPGTGLTLRPTTAGASAASARASERGSVEVLPGGGGLQVGWLAWAAAMAAGIGLAGAAAWRMGPAVAGRLRHQP